MTDEQKVILKRKGNEPIAPNVFFGGLSKREFFVAVALTKMDLQAHVAEPASEQIAKSCVEIADAIIKELNK
jgi:hypothetical protein